MTPWWRSSVNSRDYLNPNICVFVYPWEKKEEILPLLSKEGSGKGAVEEHQEHNLPLPPNDSVYILPSPTAHSTPETPFGKAISSAMPALQNIRKLVATVRAFATTSKTLAVAHTAWHSGWFGCWFRHGAPGPQQLHWFGEAQSPPLFVLISLVLSYLILFYFYFFNFSL